MKRIYLDNNATTMMDATVITAMLPFLSKEYGNASSVLNSYGQYAQNAVNNALEKLTDILHSSSKKDIIFTSGATEANNLALSGIIQSFYKKNPHIIVSAIEHQSVLQVCRFWEMHGVQCTYLPVKTNGIIDLEDLQKAIQKNTILISIMAANNEIGTIQPIFEIGEIAHENNVLFHTDATQYIYYKIVDVKEIPVDLLSFSAHKIHGPKGIGVLYANANARRNLKPLLFGGGQQGGIRSGTLNVPGIIGIAKAVEILAENQCKENLRIKALRDEFYSLICKNCRVSMNGDMEKRIPNNLNICFHDIQSLTLVGKIPELACSTVSACSSENVVSSHVLRAIHLSEQDIHSSIRLGLSKYTTEEEIKYASSVIEKVLAEL